MALVILAGGATLLLGYRPTPAQPLAAELVRQFEAAVRGTAPSQHVYGGALSVDRKDGVLTVIAEDIPQKACVSAGWDLVRKGTLTINDVTPLRISAAKLSELCYEEETARIKWVPKPPGG